MKKILFILIMSVFITSGCSSKETINELQMENEQLIQEYELLLIKHRSDKNEQESSHKETLAKLEIAEMELNHLRAEKESMEQAISNFQKAFEVLEIDSKEFAQKLNMFSLEGIRVGDKVAGLTVSDKKDEVANGSKSYFIDFDGELEVKGKIIINETGGSRYTLMVEEDMKKVPHTVYHLGRNKIFFSVLNDAPLLALLGKELDQLMPDEHIEIEAVFRQFKYNFVPETDVKNFAEFVRLSTQQ